MSEKKGIVRSGFNGFTITMCYNELAAVSTALAETISRYQEQLMYWQQHDDPSAVQLADGIRADIKEHEDLLERFRCLGKL